MLLREEDTDVFKRWLLPKLETISDADDEVLADYVIALVTANESEPNIRRNCLDSLADFLQDNTAPFVDDVIKTLKSKSYDPRAPSHAGPIPSIVGNSTNTEYEPRSPRSANSPPLHAPTAPAAIRALQAQHRLPDRPPGPSTSHSPGLNIQHDRGQGSKKRKQVQRDTSETRDGQDSHYTRSGTGNRPMKQIARWNGKNAADGSALRGGAASFAPQNAFPGYPPMPNMSTMPNMLSMAHLPPPPPGPVPFDMNNPMAFFAMMAALGTAIPGMPPLPALNPRGNGRVRQGICPDYHTKGFCALGTLCSFEHGEADNAADDAPEYDPNQHSLNMGWAAPSNGRQGVNKTYHNSKKGGKPRADFSLPGPTTDRTITTLVVEQIPEAHFTEENVRGYFSQFGTIVDVEMYAHRRLATVKFEDHAAASQAYNSPKAVFENRFVKVYWMRLNTVLDGPKRSYGDVEIADADDLSHVAEPVLSREEIEKRQAEAQKAFEERNRKWAEAEAKSADIDRQLKEKDAEIQDIKRQLAELAGEEFDGKDEAENKLASLQAEAAMLFGTDDYLATTGRGRGYPPRVAYRGRGHANFPPWGHRAPRGSSYHGRESLHTHFACIKSRVKRLDHRPRRIAVAGIEKDTPKDETLRQWLATFPECIRIEHHPEKPNTVILTFQERYHAESFVDLSRNIVDTGPLELFWVPNEAFGGIKPSTTTTTTQDADVQPEAHASDDDDSSATIGEQEDAVDTKKEADMEAEESGQTADADMDVADDVDQWL
ncbi:hypothetical protein CC86DRAFT_364350 [Ophiobolus disseminans]|uniref:RNA-binding domain-containing protein n=1 Tax=Ophiobolus disseminans TaxID=1469910 RepID=A0A6A6ZCP4_9PLEO|nr:hypothetical protein CC86DRAFT_364350 [Ophiobolus disseminans]